MSDALKQTAPLRQTLPIERGSTRMIAHRGLSGIERENSASAFVAAGNRSYYGIETDVYRTADGKFALIHDSKTGRVADRNLPVEASTLAELRSLRLIDSDGEPREDLVIPTPEEYFRICRRYGKVSVLELKSEFTEDELIRLIVQAKQADQLEYTTFISFSIDNLRKLRRLLPSGRVEYLVDRPIDGELIELLSAERMAVDACEKRLNPKVVADLHSAGIEINCWTVDSPERGAELVAMGVDELTTNLLE